MFVMIALFLDQFIETASEKMPVRG